MKSTTRVYDSYDRARQTVQDLERAGISSNDISLVANKHVSDATANMEETSSAAAGVGLGAAVGGGAGLLAGLGMLAIPGLGPVVAAGWLAATAVGAVGGATAGGLIGALVDLGVSREEAEVYAESVRRGGTMLTVRYEDSLEPTVRAILDRQSPIDPVRRREEYQTSGWKSFDPNAAPYRPSKAEIERIRRGEM